MPPPVRTPTTPPSSNVLRPNCLSGGLRWHRSLTTFSSENRNGESTCTIEESVQKLESMKHWRPVEWTNALGQPITIQVGSLGWLAHRQDASDLVESSRFDADHIEDALRRNHLGLQATEWQDGFSLDTWPVVDASTSRAFIARVSQELADREVDHIVVCPRTDTESEPCDIRTPQDQTRRAEEVLSELYAKIEALQQHG